MTPLRRRIMQRLVLLSLASLVAACGGDETETASQEPLPSSSAPPPSNSAPPPADPAPPNPPQTPPPSNPPTTPPPTEPPPSEPGNGAPVIGGTPLTEVMVGDSYSFQPAASDPDGDALTFSVQNLPSWASFDTSNGRISGTPDSEHIAQYSNVRIGVTDGEAVVQLPAFSIDVVATALGAATLSWSAPTARTDGTPLDVVRYKVYWGTDSRDYANSTTLDAGVSTHVIGELTRGTWYFAVTALDEHNIESDYSNEASKQVM